MKSAYTGNPIAANALADYLESNGIKVEVWEPPELEQTLVSGNRNIARLLVDESDLEEARKLVREFKELEIDTGPNVGENPYNSPPDNEGKLPVVAGEYQVPAQPSEPDTNYWAIGFLPFFVYGCLSLGVFISVWVYKQWTVLRRVRDSPIAPIFAAMFSPFFFYILANQMLKQAREQGYKSFLGAPALALTFLYVCFMSWNRIELTILMPFVGLTCFYPLIKAARKINGVDENRIMEILEAVLVTTILLIFGLTVPLLALEQFEINWLKQISCALGLRGAASCLW